MNLQTEKLSLIQELINLNDKELILKIKNLFKKSSKTSLKPMTIETFFEKIDASERAYQKGEYIFQSVMEKEISKWKKKK